MPRTKSQYTKSKKNFKDYPFNIKSKINFWEKKKLTKKRNKNSVESVLTNPFKRNNSSPFYAAFANPTRSKKTKASVSNNKNSSSFYAAFANPTRSKNRSKNRSKK